MIRVKVPKPFVGFSWGVLAVNILIILWGAYVRVTGSGAGCGSHWPLCNGEVIPQSQQVETTIEFIHRLMSGLGLMAVLGMWIWCLFIFPKKHPARKAAGLSVVFILMEALVGALLVLFRLVKNDESVARVVFIAVHLVNTFLLLGSLTLISWWVSGKAVIGSIRNEFKTWATLLAFICIFLIGINGAITALGDTLFPVQTVMQGLQQDFISSAHFLIRLRVWHPVLAILSAIFIFSLLNLEGFKNSDVVLRRLAWVLRILFTIQLGFGALNLFLLAPAAMQIIHLLMADMVWISLVLFAAHLFRQREVVIELINSGE